MAGQGRSCNVPPSAFQTSPCGLLPPSTACRSASTAAVGIPLSTRPTFAAIRTSLPAPQLLHSRGVDLVRVEYIGDDKRDICDTVLRWVHVGVWVGGYCLGSAGVLAGKSTTLACWRPQPPVVFLAQCVGTQRSALLIAPRHCRLRERVGPSGFVFTSGGIGPTHDDITYEARRKTGRSRTGLFYAIAWHCLGPDAWPHPTCGFTSLSPLSTSCAGHRCRIWLPPGAAQAHR